MLSMEGVCSEWFDGGGNPNRLCYDYDVPSIPGERGLMKGLVAEKQRDGFRSRFSNAGQLDGKFPGERRCNSHFCVRSAYC